MATTIKDFTYRGIRCEVVQWLDAYEVKLNGNHTANLPIDNWTPESVKNWITGQIDSLLKQ